MKLIGCWLVVASIAFLGIAIYCNLYGDIRATVSTLLASYSLLFAAWMSFASVKDE